MVEFVSEPIEPRGMNSGAEAAGRGEPALPERFGWNGVEYAVVAKLGQWKASAHEGGRADGELYLRRHYYRLGMSDGSVWTVYFVRQPPRGGAAKSRWFVYTIDSGNHNGFDGPR